MLLRGLADHHGEGSGLPVDAHMLNFAPERSNAAAVRIALSEATSTETENMMHDLKQVQPITREGHLVGLLGLDGQGRIYYGDVRGSTNSGRSVIWNPIEEKEK